MNLSPAFEQLLRASGASSTSPDDIVALSDFYLTHPGAPTPWRESFAAPAYLAYFLPLNYVRVRAALAEVRRFVPADLIGSIVDFGSGTGAAHFALEDEAWLGPRTFHCVERSRAATDLHRQLAERRGGAWSPEFSRPSSIAPRTLGIFSYSFLEMQNDLPDLDAFDHLLIVEPSTRECGRQLMTWRQRLIDRGFAALAPCTHEQACPLLTESPRDWCHHRVSFAAPAWWLELESRLPMTNHTLTYSYLLASRLVGNDAWRGAGRVIGDTLRERGKTRQMICRGPRREFLSWLLRHGEPDVVPRGALVRGLETTEPRGPELRVGDRTHLEIEV